MNKPYSIKIFLPGGDPDGLRTIEKSNWSGAGIVIPRALMGEAKTRRELARTGVYVLVGPPEESGLPRIYVGEGDPIKPRLEQHAGKKVLKPAGDGYLFTQDYVFNSPSTAAGVVQGRSANGRIDWKTKDGKTLKQLQDADTQA